MSIKKITIKANVPEDITEEDIQEIFNEMFLLTNHSEDDFYVTDVVSISKKQSKTVDIIRPRTKPTEDSLERIKHIKVKDIYKKYFGETEEWENMNESVSLFEIYELHTSGLYFYNKLHIRWYTTKKDIIKIIEKELNLKQGILNKAFFAAL